jgi:S1-C subfamily serine protease
MSVNLEDIFTKIRPSIVAFCSNLAKGRNGGPPLMAPIMGTGFVVHEAGVVVTNRHVAQAMLELPRHPDTGGLLASALLFADIEREERGFGLAAHFIEIVQLQMISEFTTSNECFYGEEIPDVAFAQLAVRGLVPVTLATAEWSIRVGMEIATAGFPLGEDPLVVHGFVSQGTPLLRRGIVSAVNPFPCPHPDAFTIDVISQGGASGSPIFRTDHDEVIGILYAGFPNVNITYAVPSLIVSEALKMFLNEHLEDPAAFPTYREIAESQRQAPQGRSPWRAV